MNRILTAAAAAALFAIPAVAQDVSVGAEASREPTRDQTREQQGVAPLGDASEMDAMGAETQEQIPGEDQTAKVPGDDADVTAIPGGADEPVGSARGDAGELDRNQGGQGADELSPPIEDDQTARVPGDDADLPPAPGEADESALPQSDQSVGEAEEALPPIEDDQTAGVPGEDTDGLPALGQEGSETPAEDGGRDTERDLLRPGDEPAR